jgi:SAM-dependent methyltransferase
MRYNDGMAQTRHRPSSGQTVSRKRVADYGEVYTAPREVNAMLDLVGQEAERAESRFLEPACGTGNFLVEALARKLRKIAERCGGSRVEYERASLCAVASLYGIDILEDTVQKCRARLFAVFQSDYIDRFGLFPDEGFPRSVRYVLDKNIIWGDALTLKTAGDNPKPITFSEWAFIADGMVKRRDFTFSELLYQSENNAMSLFSDSGEEVFIPKPKREYPLTRYLKLYTMDKTDGTGRNRNRV